MSDVLVVAVTLGFFALCVAYVHLCDRIIGPDEVEQEPAAERSASDAGTAAR